MSLDQSSFPEDQWDPAFSEDEPGPPTIADVATYLEIKSANFLDALGDSMAEGWAHAAIDVRMIADGVFDPRESATDDKRQAATETLAQALEVPSWMLDSSLKKPWRARLAEWLWRVVHP